MIELIIFDCDGVIVDSEIVANKSSAMTKRELGWDISDEEHMLMFCGHGPDSPVIQDAWARLPDEYHAKSQARRIELMKAELQPIPNIKTVLENLELPFCMASNSLVDKINFMLDLTDLSHLFEERVFSSQHVEKGKPSPDLYLHAADTMGVAPEKCLVVEDSIPGATAGIAANMNVLGFVGGSHQPFMNIEDTLLELGVHQLFDDMSKLPQIIDAFLRKTA